MATSKTTRSKTGRAGKSARAGKTAAKAVKTSRSASKGARGAAKSGRTAGKASAAGKSRTSRVSTGISRIDQEATRTHGFFVRVGYERTESGSWRPKHRAFFGDATHGGRAKAQKAAEDWLKKVKK